MLSKKGVAASSSRPASDSTPQQRALHASDPGGNEDLQDREERTAAARFSTPRRLYPGDSSSELRRTDDADKSPPQASGPGVNLSEIVEDGLAATAVRAASAATAAVLYDPDAGDRYGRADGEDWFDVNNENVTDFKYDYKEAICLDLSRAGGVAAVATQSTPGATGPADATGFSGKGGAHHGESGPTNGNDTHTITGVEKTSKRGNINPMDMSIRGKYEMRRFTAAVAATATATAAAAATASAADGAKPAPSVAGLSRRKAPMTPAIRYLMEAMCTDLQCCGECFVPHFRSSQTLVRFCGFVPFEVDEGLDEQTRRFMEGESACDAASGGGNAAAGGEAYGRGIGLPGIAWASSRATLVEISTLTSDDSFDCGGVRCELNRRAVDRGTLH